MNKQQIAKQALAETWAWANEDGAKRSNARSFIENAARRQGIDLENLDATPEGFGWVTFCEELTRGLNADDSETRECAREWSDSGWYDESSGRAASMIWRKMRAND